VLPAVLQRSGRLPATHAVDGEELRLGRIYVAPPDHHLLVDGPRVRLSRGPRVNGHRPGIDPLFMSASRHGARVIGAVLSGVLDDGTRGVLALGRAGAVTIAQDPDEALYAAMPQNAIESAGVAHVLRVAAIAARIAELAGTEVPDERPQEEEDAMGDIEDELGIGRGGAAPPRGPASGFTCPECHGALWELDAEQVVRFRCRVGHSYGSETLLSEQSEKIEQALWAGCRALEESAALAKRLADRAEARGAHPVAARYMARHEEASARAATLRELVERGQIVSAEQGRGADGD
jgi:two-component system chemotaxis response regulator CheB